MNANIPNSAHNELKLQIRNASTNVAPSSSPQRISANVGDNVILKCALEFPNKVKTPYLIHWLKNGQQEPIYIFYTGYPQHLDDGYKERVSLLNPTEASLNLTNVRETDQGWYECKVFYLIESDPKDKNGTWVLLEVNSPPHFKEKPPETVFVKTGDSLTVHCRAHGTPTPTVIWQKDNSQLQNSATVHVHGGELHLKGITEKETGTYVCIAKNRQGTLQTNTQVLISKAAVIVNPPRNTTVLENNRVEMSCGAKGTPSNITYRWYHKGILTSQLSWLAHRIDVLSDGSLVIKSATADDSGKFTCDATNGIGEPDTAVAYLSVEYAARVTYSPTRQYLPLGLSGIVKCFIQASPPLQFATWTKDRRPFDPSTMPNVELLSNGSLLFTQVTHEHQGFYRCTPYNIQGTGQSSNSMEVIVREPPMFKMKPNEYYVAAMEEDVTMSCEGMGQPKPTIVWKRVGTGKLPKDRTFIRNGNITITNLRKEDFGKYECILKNEIATLVAHTTLRMNGTTPYSPTNVTINTSAFAATVMWHPNFDGGLPQHFSIRYRFADDDESGWKTMRVQPPDSKAFSIYNLQSDSEYEFQVFATNQLGRGPGSEPIRARTKNKSEMDQPIKPSHLETTTAAVSADSFNSPTTIPDIAANPTSLPTPSGPGIDPPRNISIEKMAQGWVVSWLPPPFDPDSPVASYKVQHREGEGEWIFSESISKDTAYLIKELKTSVKYTFRVWAYTIRGVGSVSTTLEYKITNNNLNIRGPRAITAGVVGSVLFFVAAIILSVCTVKICNKRKQRKMEKAAYMMVTCPVMDGVNGTRSNHNSPITLKQIAQANKKDLHKAEYQV
ncbi:Protein turtle B [Blomia tropicalis]|nr:Protein turtle B [Blomia tropicalis]